MDSCHRCHQIKKELMSLLKDVSVFLDTDDLSELGKLEEYVQVSCSQ